MATVSHEWVGLSALIVFRSMVPGAVPQAGMKAAPLALNFTDISVAKRELGHEGLFTTATFLLFSWLNPLNLAGLEGRTKKPYLAHNDINPLD